MTGRLAKIARTPRTRILSSLAAILLIAGCTNYYEIPIETPIKPKLDVSAFQRVLVAAEFALAAPLLVAGALVLAGSKLLNFF